MSKQILTGAAGDRTAEPRMIWIGRVLSGLASAFFALDAVMKFIQPRFVIDATRDIGWPADSSTLSVLGGLLLVSTALYLIPRTAVLGAILLTGYLGGAVASHARIGSPLFTHELFGVYLGVFRLGRPLVAQLAHQDAYSSEPVIGRGLRRFPARAERALGGRPHRRCAACLASPRFLARSSL